MAPFSIHSHKLYFLWMITVKRAIWFLFFIFRKIGKTKHSICFGFCFSYFGFTVTNCTFCEWLLPKEQLGFYFYRKIGKTKQSICFSFCLSCLVLGFIQFWSPFKISFLLCLVLRFRILKWFESVYSLTDQNWKIVWFFHKNAILLQTKSSQ